MGISHLPNPIEGALIGAFPSGWKIYESLTKNVWQSECFTHSLSSLKKQLQYNFKCRMLDPGTNKDCPRNNKEASICQQLAVS